MPVSFTGVLRYKNICMEQKVFDVRFEFDKHKVDSIIEECINNNGKGYVCSVEANIMANTYYNPNYKNIINNALVNICDGGSIAFFASMIHKKKFNTYIGADLFIEYNQNRNYRYFFLGNSPEVLNGLKKNLSSFNASINQMRFETLPFEKVENFDYQSIANMINEDNPDIIWVSLGAPKQEEFMYRILPYINRGVMFGFGAIFDFYSGANNIKRAPKLFLALKIEWVYRLALEPKKQGKRIYKYIKILPKLITEEIRAKKK
jgi:N-acetylglucosaminyldiphosphoundecaprenol N-acetyl-beta-D-mannosaminyltransferase